MKVSSTGFADKRLWVLWDPGFDIRTVKPRTHILELLTAKYRLGRIHVNGPASNIKLQSMISSGLADGALTDTTSGFFDMAVGGFMVQAAGGKSTDKNDNPITPETEVAVFSNGIIHDDLLEMVRKSYSDFK